MYHDEHAPPHFHAIYQGDQAVIDIESLPASTPPGTEPCARLGQIDQNELRANWQQVENSKPLNDIDALE